MATSVRLFIYRVEIRLRRVDDCHHVKYIALNQRLAKIVLCIWHLLDAHDGLCASRVFAGAKCVFECDNAVRVCHRYRAALSRNNDIIIMLCVLFL